MNRPMIDALGSHKIENCRGHFVHDRKLHSMLEV